MDQDHYENAPEYHGREFHPYDDGFSLFIRAGVNLLSPELKAIKEANERRQIGPGWQLSSTFRRSLWRDFRQEFNLTPQGLLTLREGGEVRFGEVNTAIHHLKSMVTLLDVLKTAAQDILTPFETELTRTANAFGRRLDSLPAELLALVFSFACNGAFDLMGFSQVNRRFRSVAHGMSSKWSDDLDSDMAMNFLRFCLDKSKNAPLHYKFSGGCDGLSWGPSESDLRSSLREVAQRCSRWKNIGFNVSARENGYHHDPFLSYRSINELLLAGIHAPQLTDLSFYHRGFLPGSVRSDLIHQTIQCVHFYRTWKVANLRSLTFVGIVPVTITGTSIETLTLDIRIRRKFMDLYLVLQDLHAFLRETPTLREVTIQTYTSGKTKHPQNHIRDFPIITLKYLQKMSLTLDERVIYTNSCPHFSPFLDCLRTPSLSSLDVKMALIPFEDTVPCDITTFVKHLMPQNLGADYLKELSLFIYDTSPARMIKELPLGGFPSIQTLTLGTSRLLVLSLGFHQDVMERGSLEEINLVGCTRRTQVALDRDFERSFRIGNGRNVQSLVAKNSILAWSGRSVRLRPTTLDIEGTAIENGEECTVFRSLGYYCGCNCDALEEDEDFEDDDEEEEEEEEF